MHVFYELVVKSKFPSHLNNWLHLSSFCLLCTCSNFNIQTIYFDGRNGENSRLAFWKRPLLVKGPLGVVSAIELAFLAMFIALLIWTYSTRLTIRFSEINRGIYHHHNDSHDHDKRYRPLFTWFWINVTRIMASSDGVMKLADGSLSCEVQLIIWHCLGISVAPFSSSRSLGDHRSCRWWGLPQRPASSIIYGWGIWPWFYSLHMVFATFSTGLLPTIWSR